MNGGSNENTVYFSSGVEIVFLNILFKLKLFLVEDNTDTVLNMLKDESSCSGGQLESLCYFDHHTHFLTCTVIILSCNRVL